MAVAPATLALWDALGVARSDEAAEEALAARASECVAHGASVTDGARHGLTALHRACAGGHTRAALVLADAHGAPLDATDATGTTPLAVAAGRGHADLCTALLARGADPSLARDDRSTPLHLACEGGHLSTALALADGAGAERAGLCAKDASGRTPAMALARALVCADVDPAALRRFATAAAAAAAAARRADRAPAAAGSAGNGDTGAAGEEAARAHGVTASSPTNHAPAAAREPPPPPPPAAAATTPATTTQLPPTDAAVGAAAGVRLSREEGRRYGRHLLLPQFGVAGQLRLKGSRVLVVGAGGLGSPVLLYLAAAGVGTLVVVDDDAVEESNLQRQILHSMATVGRPKTESAAAAVAALNPHVRVERVHARLSRHNALQLVSAADAVADCTDSIDARYTLSDACAHAAKPLVYGAISQFEGHVSTFRLDTPDAPSYRDLYPKRAPPGAVQTCAAAGVLGVLPAVIGALQATELLKLLTGLGAPLGGRLLLYDALGMRFDELPIGRRAGVPPPCEQWALGAAEAAAAGDAAGTCSPPPTVASAAPAAEDPVRTVGAAEAARRMRDERWDPFVLDVRTPAEAAISAVPGTHARASLDEACADTFAGLGAGRDVLLYCRTGVRSRAACIELVRRGLLRAGQPLSLRGGVNAWAEEVDGPEGSMLQY